MKNNKKSLGGKIQITLPTLNKIIFCSAGFMMLILFILSLWNLYINTYVIILFIIITFLYAIVSYLNVKNRKISLTQKEFIQRGTMSGQIQWENVDRIEFLKGKFFYRLFIYHKESGRIERFIVEYEYIKNKKQFIDSLKKISLMYDFEFTEKPWYEIEKNIWKALDKYIPPNHEKYLFIKGNQIPWSTINTISIFKGTFGNQVLALYFKDGSPPKSFNFDAFKKKDELIQSIKDNAPKNNYTLHIST